MIIDKELTEQEIRTKYFNVVSLGCFLVATHQSSPYKKTQNHLLISTLAEMLETQRYTDLTYDITDIFAKIADAHPYDVIVDNFGAATSLPEEAKQSIVYLLMVFIFLSESYVDDNTMGLLGDFCRELQFNSDKATAMLEQAKSDALYYFVMEYAEGFDDSFKILSDTINRSKSNRTDY